MTILYIMFGVSWLMSLILAYFIGFSSGSASVLNRFNGAISGVVDMGKQFLLKRNKKND